MASWLVSSSLDRAVRVRALAGDTVLCSWTRHLTLTVPLFDSPRNDKWIPTNCWGNLTNCWRVTCVGQERAEQSVQDELKRAKATRTKVYRNLTRPCSLLIRRREMLRRVNGLPFVFQCGETFRNPSYIFSWSCLTYK